jgi:hypothetical protein
MSNETKNYPAFEVFVVAGEKTDSEWTKVGAAWPTKSGKGFTITLAPGVSVFGRLVLQPYEPKKGVTHG